MGVKDSPHDSFQAIQDVEQRGLRAEVGHHLLGERLHLLIHLGRVGGEKAKVDISYSSVDALFDWTRKFSAWQLAFYVQMRTVTDRSNAVAYSASWQETCQRDTLDAPFCDRDSDRFESGLPRGTTLGIRIAF